MLRKNIASQTNWEPIIGYSRAVCLGSYVYVSGTTSTDEMGRIVWQGDPYKQTVQIIKKIEAVLFTAGASLKDIARTRIYVVNISDWEKIGRAHAEFFQEIRPACTMVEVSRLIDPELLVEIEADAIIS